MLIAAGQPHSSVKFLCFREKKANIYKMLELDVWASKGQQSWLQNETHGCISEQTFLSLGGLSGHAAGGNADTLQHLSLDPKHGISSAPRTMRKVRGNMNKCSA